MLKHGEWEFYLSEGKAQVGVVLVHEIFGLNDYIRSVAREFSKNGYWAVAVDLFRGKTPTTVEEGRKIRESLSNAEVLDAMWNGLELLKEKAGRSVKVGTMGFCMGGGFALLASSKLGFDFCVDYYGLVQNVEEIEQLKGPVQLVLAGEDERVNTWAFQSFLPTAVKHKKRVDVHLYPNARHGFHRPNWEGNHPEAAKNAWSKTLQFLSSFR